MMLTERQRHAVLGGLLLASVAALLATLAAHYRYFLAVQVFPPGARTIIIGGGLRTDALSVGNHTLTFRGRTRTGQAISTTTSFTVDPHPGGGGGTGGGGGGESGGGGEELAPARGRRARRHVPQLPATVTEVGPPIITTAERTGRSAPRLVGDQSFSSDRQRHGLRTGLLLAHGRVRAEYVIAARPGDYLVELTAQHDRPAPVQIAVYVNERPWKVVTFRRGNGRFEQLPVGILRNFSRGTLTLRFVNDYFDAAQFGATEDERHDRNAFIDEIRLTLIE